MHETLLRTRAAAACSHDAPSKSPGSPDWMYTHWPLGRTGLERRSNAFSRLSARCCVPSSAAMEQLHSIAVLRGWVSRWLGQVGAASLQGAQLLTPRAHRRQRCCCKEPMVMMQASSSWFRRCEGAWAIRKDGLPNCESATTAAHRARRTMARTEFLRLQAGLPECEGVGANFAGFANIAFQK